MKRKNSYHDEELNNMYIDFVNIGQRKKKKKKKKK